MWLLPLLVAGVVAVAAATRSARAARTPLPSSRQLPSGPSAVSGLAGQPARSPRRNPAPPGPIAVLGEFLRVGQVPPPPVILCAIAEAQAIGRVDLASDIVRAFVDPVMRRHARLRAEAQQDQASPPPEVSYQAAAPADDATASPLRPHAEPNPPRTDSASEPPTPPTVDDFTALLDTDPVRFMEMASRPGAFARATAAQATAPSTAVPDGTREPAAQAEASLPRTVDAPLAPAPGSPLVEVPDGAWQAFVARLERESPDFASSRHVGRYRQRRERLADLGIDPNAIHGSPSAQRAALDADLADAHRHAAAGGLLAHLGRPIVVPGRDDAEPLTLSGLLGVIQCAGLDGAVGWLERSSDRKRYPHTTQVFRLTNGAF